jgi:hypothetical protein
VVPGFIRGARAAILFAAMAAGSTGMYGCAHRAAATIHDDTATISGHNTGNMTPSDARRVVLIEAAAITVDHGYRLFQVTMPITPGVPVTVHLYGKGEIDPNVSGVYDANAIAAGELQ